MGIKNPHNSERKTRNSSRGRSPGRGALPAGASATNVHSRVPGTTSPSDNEPLPVGEVNKVSDQAAVAQSAISPSANSVVKITNESLNNPDITSQESVLPNLLSTDVLVSVTTQTESSTADVSDIQGGLDSGPSDSSSDKAMMLVLSELKEIRAEMGSIRKIEETTASIQKELSGIGARTTDLEEAFEATSARVRELGDDISTLNTVAKKHEQSLVALKKMKEDISDSTDNKVKLMNEMLEVQKGQAESFQASVIHVKQDISEEVDRKLEKKFEQLAQASHFQSLREQAFGNRFNLVISGLAEDTQKSTADLVKHFLESTLGIKKVEFASGFRMGPAPAVNQSYVGPILVKFRNFYQRNRVWKKRHTTTGENEDQKIRITADLPKELREGVQLLYKVANAASKYEQFSSARVFNYQLELGDKVYQPSQLEDLPIEIRPSTLASPRSDNALAFFTKRSFLSNHFPSEFVIEGEKYFTVEQYLAVKRAIFSDNPEMIRKAKTARDPKQAKYVLNSLKEDRPDQWYEGIEEVLLEGLRAKFLQNSTLRASLIDTKNLLLGEASKDLRWGIGMTLADPDVLNHSLWNPEGNLLGRSLMKIRAEMPWETSESS